MSFLTMFSFIPLAVLLLYHYLFFMSTFLQFIICFCSKNTKGGRVYTDAECIVVNCAKHVKYLLIQGKQ